MSWDDRIIKEDKMPTYEYECSACSHGFEVLQSMLDKKLRKCPACGKMTLKRLIGTGSGIVFKGSGFYETDYKRKGKKPSEGKESSSDASSKPCCQGGSCAGTTTTT